jgi:hypothetical protein
VQSWIACLSSWRPRFKQEAERAVGFGSNRNVAWVSEAPTFRQ